MKAAFPTPGVAIWPYNGPGTVTIPQSADDNFTGIMTFYASSTEGGATDQLNTVEVVAGLIVTWTQESPGIPGTTGEPIGLLLALTYA